MLALLRRIRVAVAALPMLESLARDAEAGHQAEARPLLQFGGHPLGVSSNLSFLIVQQTGGRS